MNLNDKVIVVTGGSGLLGKAMISYIKSLGGIAIEADIHKETDLANNYIHFDVCSESSIQNAYDIIKNKFGKIDGIVNNAYPRTKDWGAKFEDISVQSWKDNIDLQLNSVFVCIQKIMPYLLESKGSVVNIASIYGVVGNDLTMYEGTKINTAAPYAAIKGGLINFTRYLASYYGKSGVRFNCVSPGGIFDHQDPKFVSNYNSKCPMGRMGLPEDIAPSVAFLLSNDAGYITGQNIIVDGGWTAI